MRRTFAIGVLFATACAHAAAQATPPDPQRLTILIDPARGGNEYGARIDEHTYEKQVTLALANRLRSLLMARDFDVVLTRETDTLTTNDQRATRANQSRPVACLLLHSAGSGTGLHLYTSSLDAVSPGKPAVLWNEAQAPFVQRSQRLANELTTALSRSRFAVSSGRTWIRPLDNMQCPAVAIEMAPENSDTPASDSAYQRRVAEAIASSLLFWRGHTDVVQSILSPPHDAPPPDPEKAAVPSQGQRGGSADSGSPASGSSAAAAKTAVVKAAPSAPPKPKPAASEDTPPQ